MGYLCIIAAAMIVDYIILSVAAQAGIEVALKAFFGLLVAVWYILNELLSINRKCRPNGRACAGLAGKIRCCIKK